MRWYPDVILTEIKKKNNPKNKTKQKRRDTIRKEI